MTEISARTTQSVEALRARLGRLEQELGALYATLTASREAVSLPGLHLCAEVRGQRIVVPAALVLEVAPLVQLAPVPGAPEWTLGTLVYRGSAAHAVDLGTLLGLRGDLRLEAQMLIIGGETPVALVIDRVVGLVDAPALVAAGTHQASSKFVAGVCKIGEELHSLIAVDAVSALPRGC